MFSVAKAKRQLQMFYLCESEATATKRSVRTEINSRFAEEPYLLNFIGIIVQQQHEESILINHNGFFCLGPFIYSSS
ncbi:hypothetical protein [Lysinibacillus xylanilyticus]|uniref:hypothetical protein n=1 Tax=Lysinibacillus xylanilyticus TaxID=582475 RepID=UPI0037F90D0C